MPDEKGRTQADKEDLPATPLHAHGSAIEDDTDRPREDEDRGERLDDAQNRADQATNTGGATSGRPPREQAGDDPSNA